MVCPSRNSPASLAFEYCCAVPVVFRHGRWYCSYRGYLRGQPPNTKIFPVSLPFLSWGDIQGILLFPMHSYSIINGIWREPKCKEEYCRSDRRMLQSLFHLFSSQEVQLSRHESEFHCVERRYKFPVIHQWVLSSSHACRIGLYLKCLCVITWGDIATVHPSSDRSQ